MVDYLGIERIRTLVARQGVGGFIAALAREIEHDYRRWPAFITSARHAAYSRNGVIELMPISDGRLYACKYVNGHPANTARGLLTVTAFGVLSDVECGYPLLLADLTLMTALRTAAMSALAAQWLARPDSRVMAVIGNGAQSEFQCIAFHELVGIREFRLFDIDRAAMLKLERNLQGIGLAGLGITRCASADDAVRGADIVTTATADKRHAAVITPRMLRPGMHLNAIGGDSPGKTELDPGIFARSDLRVVVEFEPQARIEGEIQQLPPTFPVTEFAAIVSGHASARTHPEQITIFDSVGFALEDFSALRFLYDLQRASGAQSIDLVPELADPRDLFSLLDACSVATRARRTRIAANESRDPAHAA